MAGAASAPVTAARRRRRAGALESGGRGRAGRVTAVPVSCGPVVAAFDCGRAGRVTAVPVSCGPAAAAPTAGRVTAVPAPWTPVVAGSPAARRAGSRLTIIGAW
ncbi:hypothetical protein Ate01nite_59010 [Actinoplanes teichomyceticus]|nr:hypothetical protein Ate01nite_59010 [Actinoplanes teichomyceticus]